MAKIFVTSDPHFSDPAVATVFRKFTSVEEHDATITANWNRVVHPEDKIYVLGDISMRRKNLSIMSKLNGSKRLILGNHDIYNWKDYRKYFKEVYAHRKLDYLWLSHIPVHPQFFTFGLQNFINVHGHFHANEHLGDRYINVSQEYTGYTPVAIEDLLTQAKARLDQINELRTTN